MNRFKLENGNVLPKPYVTEMMNADVMDEFDTIKKLISSLDKIAYSFYSILFSTPSAAAVVVLGRRANGWKEWKNTQGITLNEMKRS